LLIQFVPVLQLLVAAVELQSMVLAFNRAEQLPTAPGSGQQGGPAVGLHFQTSRNQQKDMSPTPREPVRAARRIPTEILSND
jgi:hypothetical protein